ncbi:glycosyltransferase [Salinithrix halophila]|uniref:Glycosyltransferase n=1 Tax=Salinithrix halophila TaxID=1485204 RepID=A0ABV8JI35_9BACL
MNATLPNNSGITIITCTKRALNIHHLLRNYRRQLWRRKELIVILNHNKLPLHVYEKAAKQVPQVSVYQLSESISLGECLNFGVSRARYEYIAKFDDDDYYAPSYLTDCMRVMKQTEADVVGKRSHYIWLQGSNALILRKVPSPFLLPGATLFIKKRVFHKVRFSRRNAGEDDQFCRDCRAKGFKLVSAGKSHFIAVRHSQNNHTWRISDRELLSHPQNRLVAFLKNSYA